MMTYIKINNKHSIRTMFFRYAIGNNCIQPLVIDVRAMRLSCPFVWYNIVNPTIICIIARFCITQYYMFRFNNLKHKYVSCLPRRHRFRSIGITFWFFLFCNIFSGCTKDQGNSLSSKILICRSGTNQPYIVRF